MVNLSNSVGCNFWGFHQVLCSAPHREGESLGILARELLETVWQGLEEPTWGLRLSVPAVPLPFLAGQPHHLPLSSGSSGVIQDRTGRMDAGGVSAALQQCEDADCMRGLGGPCWRN